MINLEVNDFKQDIYGNSYLSEFGNILLRSLPEALHLLFPRITPSGFNIGMMKKLACLLSSIADLSDEHRKFINPFSIRDPFD